MKKILLLLAMFVCCDLICQSSGDYRSKTSGTWITASNWETYNGTSWVTASTSPTSVHGAITILNGHTMTVGSSVTVDQVVVEAGGTVVHNSASGGTVTLNDGTGTDLTIYGTWRRQGSASISLNASASIEVSNGAVYEHNIGASGGSIPTATWNTNSTLLLNYSVNISSAPTNLTQTFGKFEINCPNQTSNNIVIKPTNVVTEYRVTSTGTGSFELQDLEIDGNYIQSGGTMKVRSSTGASTANIKGSFQLNGGTFMITDANGSANAVTLTIDGNCELSGGTFIFGNTSSTSGIGFFVIKGSMTVSSGVGFTGFFRTTSGFYINRASAGTSTLNIAHTFASGTARNCFYYNTTNVTGINELYNGTSAQSTINGTNTTPAAGYSAWPTSGSIIKNFTINNSAGVTLSNARTINTALQLLSGTLNNATNNLTMASGSTIEKTNGSLSAAPIFAGTVNLLYSENASSITNTGNEVPTSTSVLNNVTLDNTKHVNLNSNMSVNGIFTFTKGAMKCAGSNVLTFNAGSSHSGAGGQSYVIGKVSKIGNTAFTFPIGNDSLYRSVSISAPSNSSDKFSAQYFRNNPSTLFGSAKDLTLNNVSKVEYWDVSRDAGTSSVSVSLDWEATMSGVTNASDLKVAHWNSSLSKWEDLGKTNSINANSTSGFVTSNVTSNFSPFTLGSATAINPLPIELYDFDIFCYNNKLKFFWETKSEDNNHFYSILSSSDAINWSVIDTIKSKGNTSIGHQYEFLLDKKIDGKYFRLKQTDYDQKFELFPIKYFDSEMCLNYDHFIYYNQDKRTIIWNLVSDNYYFELIDYTGRVYLSGVTDLNYINIDKLNDGVYIFKLNANGITHNKKIVIKKL
jgi:hypothetical protein